MTLNFSRYLTILKLTFVLLFVSVLINLHQLPNAMAAPNHDINKSQLNNEATTPSTSSSKSHNLDRDSLSISNMPDLSPESNKDETEAATELILPTRTILTEQFRAGAWLSTSSQEFFLGYQMPWREESSIEFSVLLSTQNKYGADAVYKKYYGQGEFAEAYWSVGLYQLSDFSDFMAGWLKSKNYALRLGLGAEDILRKKRTLQAEMFATLGAGESKIYISLSYAFDLSAKPN